MASDKLATGGYFQFANILPFLRLLYRYEARGNVVVTVKKKMRAFYLLVSLCTPTARDENFS